MEEWADGAPWAGVAEAGEHVRGVFVALVARIQAVPDMDLEFHPGVPDAWFRPGPAPWIVLLRPRRHDEPGDLLLEVIRLAHELGHCMSWQNGERTAAYDAARAILHGDDDAEERRLSAAERALVLDEEARASRYGRQVLEELGLRDLSAADDHTARNLAVYKTKLAEIG